MCGDGSIQSALWENHFKGKLECEVGSVLCGMNDGHGTQDEWKGTKDTHWVLVGGLGSYFS